MSYRSDGIYTRGVTMSEKINSVYATIKHQETRVAVGRGRLVRIYNRVSLPSLKRMSNSLPLVEKQDLSSGLGWKWRGRNEETE